MEFKVIAIPKCKESPVKWKFDGNWIWSMKGAEVSMFVEAENKKKAIIEVNKLTHSSLQVLEVKVHTV